MPRHPLILDGSLTPLAGHQNCACTFYLVFKEPASALRQTRCKFRRLGNLTSLPSHPLAVNNFFRCVVAFWSQCQPGLNRGRTYRKGPAWGAGRTKKFAPSSSGANRPARQGRGTLSPFTIRSGSNAVNLGTTLCRSGFTSGVRAGAAELTADARPGARSPTRIRDLAWPPQPRVPSPTPVRASRDARPPAPYSA